MKLLLVFLVAALAGASPEFEVATVRPTKLTGEPVLNLSVTLGPSQVRIAAIPLRDIIALAYRIQPNQVIGPEWIQSTPFDISAKLPAGTQVEQIPDMLQALLAERFALVAHGDNRQADVYALVVGKPPLRLHAHEGESRVTATADAQTWALAGNTSGLSNDRGNGSSYSFAIGRFEGRKLTVQGLAIELSRYSPRPIVDVTNLSGEFDMSFEVSSERYRQMLMRAAYNSGMSIPAQMLLQMDAVAVDYLLEAVEQMGLRLESRRMPVDVMVIDAIRRTPTEN
jgi:uncharacterized protein (TIGR03435 family)